MPKKRYVIIPALVNERINVRDSEGMSKRVHRCHLNACNIVGGGNLTNSPAGMQDLAKYQNTQQPGHQRVGGP
jgi:hypothetical protein